MRNTHIHVLSLVKQALSEQDKGLLQNEVAIDIESMVQLPEHITINSIPELKNAWQKHQKHEPKSWVGIVMYHNDSSDDIDTLNVVGGG